MNKKQRMKIDEVIMDAAANDRMIPGFNVFGYEDAQAIVCAAEKLQSPVLLMTNRDACNVLPVETWGAMLSSIANNAKVFVGVHLDHCTNDDILMRAINSGYNSIMYDGSQLSLEQNISHTRKIAEIAHAKGVALEGEIGSVPYTDRPLEVKSELTEPDVAKVFENESSADWMAISIGNVHKLLSEKVPIRFDVLSEIEQATTIPLVLHGATGISDDEMTKLRKHRIGKVNIGTIIRYTFGSELRNSVEHMPDVYDRLALMQNSIAAVETKAIEIIELLCK